MKEEADQGGIGTHLQILPFTSFYALEPSLTSFGEQPPKSNSCPSRTAAQAEQQLKGISPDRTLRTTMSTQHLRQAWQMIEKFEEYKFLNSQTAMPVGAKQSPVSAKKIALRDLPSETNNFAPKPSEGSPNKDKDLDPPNETNNIASKPLEESPHKDNGSITGFAGFSGSKRKQLSSPSTLSPTQQPGYSVYNGHLVYVRRKLEAESSKVCADNVDCSESVNDGFTEMKFPRDEHEKKSMASGDEICMCSPKNCIDSPKKLSISPIEGEEYWKERFVRLQMFLKNCDQSNQEEYVQRLRSLSASGRNMHAVELEKRAIQLLLEEGKELQKMKSLNVLGKSSPEQRINLSSDVLPEIVAPQ